MADRGILFSAPMVRALLDDRKMQTRRTLDIPPITFDAVFNDDGVWHVGDALTGHRYAKLSVRHRVGDRLYVREAWRTSAHLDRFAPKVLPVDSPVFFEADAGGEPNGATGKFRQGMHMPRWASRITLIVTDVRVQRLQECSESDACAEGIVRHGRFYGLQDCDWDDAALSARAAYAYLWDSLNDKPSRPGCAWRNNPWVAAYTFRPILGNIDQVRP